MIQSNDMLPNGEIVLYEAPDGEVKLEVTLEQDTVWLSQAQMVELFQRDQSVISRHVRNVFADRELPEASNMQKLHITGSAKPTILYSLDVIISVGYRIKSPRGTQFRIWATRTLHQHLLKGYTLNERRLRQRGLHEIEQTLGLLAQTLTQNALVTDEGQAVLEVVQRYARSWQLLLAYDEDQLAETPTHPYLPSVSLSLNRAREIISQLRTTLAVRNEATTLFGQERGDLLAAILGNVEQTFDGVVIFGIFALESLLAAPR